MRGGFYPASPAAVAHAATFLRPPTSGPCALLDPCAGEGAAVRQLAGLLGCPPALTFAVELDDRRTEALKAALPGARILAPASFFGCRATLNSFSFIWLNPPFDDAYGGHRVEGQFLRHATDWLMPGGVMALVCPEDVANEYSDTRRHFTTYYQDCQIVPFPAAHRPYGEVIVFGQKRRGAGANRRGGAGTHSLESAQAPRGYAYPLPPSTGPRLFQKVEPTEPELRRLLAGSPLRAHLLAPPEAPLPSPPLALGVGHVALLLAGGHLDGVVCPAGEPPHVVRGTSRKSEFVSDVAEAVNPDGSTTTRTTISERIDLVVRTVDPTGTIRTFTDTSVTDD
jgi:hypothetical protein